MFNGMSYGATATSEVNELRSEKEISLHFQKTLLRENHL
ncbi:MAG: hypothetical protein BAJALOKI1v1_1960003 [Promethearchaeota archaeon]|nr:MAG: hypothetical protein BAJALOKI1v1_1960003 [Candidatus Lokiarchaeota archaeon]